MAKKAFDKICFALYCYYQILLSSFFIVTIIFKIIFLLTGQHLTDVSIQYRPWLTVLCFVLFLPAVIAPSAVTIMLSREFYGKERVTSSIQFAMHCNLLIPIWGWFYFVKIRRKIANRPNLEEGKI
jgi:hypothetical protein